MALVPSTQTQCSTVLLSYTALVSAYYAISPHFPAPKQNSWIITTISSCIMTFASAPFVWDYLAARGDVTAVRAFPELAVTSSRFFQAYLLADMSIGAVHYRGQLNLVTGWFHHVLYLGIIEYAIRQKWAYVFSLATCMEFPTFILGLATLFPRLRSNIFFAVSFFLTRILFHSIICIAYYLPKNRPLAPLTPLMSPTHSPLSSLTPEVGSVVPAVLLTCVFPLHASWFLGCLKGFKKRGKLQKDKNEGQTKASLQSPVVPVSLAQKPPPTNLNPNPNSRYLYTHYTHYARYYSMRYAHYSSRYAHYRARLRGLGLRGLGFRGLELRGLGMRGASTVKEQVRKRIPLKRWPSLESLPSLEDLPLIPLPGLPSPKALAFGLELPSREKVYGSVGLGREQLRERQTHSS